MKTKFQKFSKLFLASFLSIMLVISTAFVGTVSVNAAGMDVLKPGDVIYFNCNGIDYPTASAMLYADFSYEDNSNFSVLMHTETYRDSYLNPDQISKLIPLKIVEGSGPNSIYSFEIPDNSDIPEYNYIGYVKILRISPYSEGPGYRIWNTSSALPIYYINDYNCITLRYWDNESIWTTYVPPFSFKSTATPSGEIYDVKKDIAKTINIEAEAMYSDDIVYSFTCLDNENVEIIAGDTSTPSFTVKAYGTYTFIAKAVYCNNSITRTYTVNVKNPDEFVLFRYSDIGNAMKETPLDENSYDDYNDFNGYTAKITKYSSNNAIEVNYDTVFLSENLYYNSANNCYSFCYKNTTIDRQFYNIKRIDETYLYKFADSEIYASGGIYSYNGWTQQFCILYEKMYFINYYPTTGEITITLDPPTGTETIKVYPKNGIPNSYGSYVSDSWGSTKVYSYDVDTDETGTKVLTKNSVGYVKVETGKSIVVKTTVNSPQASQGYYVDSFVVNGVYYAVDIAKSGGDVYSSVPIKVDEELEITPVYYNKQFEYITVCVQSSEEVEEDWGSNINAYTWYYRDSIAMNGAYPGQPFGKTSSGLYVGKVPKYSYTFDSSGNAIQGELVIGITLNNGYENDSIHDKFLTSEQRFNLQTYDYDDFRHIVEMGFDSVKVELKYYDGNGSSSHSVISNNYKNTNTYNLFGGDYYEHSMPVAGKDYKDAVNPYEELYNFDGDAVSVIGLTSENIKDHTTNGLTALKLIDGSDLLGDLDTNKAVIKIVSVGNKDTSFGYWGTVWYVYDTTTGTLITQGTPSDFIPRGTVTNGVFTISADTEQTDAYKAIKSYTIDGISAAYYAAAISYESEQNAYYSNRNSGETGIRMDARWLYSSSVFDYGNGLVQKGKLGEDVYYKLYDNGNLVISGSGDMDLYYEGKPQWNCDITEVIIEDGVTSIGDNTFYDCTSLTNIIIPDSVTFIGDYAFVNCNSLTDVYYKGSKENWDNISICKKNILLENATIHYNYKQIIGDVDTDYELTIDDVTYLQLYIAHMVDFNNIQTQIADYNGDGIVNIYDVTDMQMDLVNM